MFVNFRLHKTWLLGVGLGLELSLRKECAVAQTTNPLSTSWQVLHSLVEILSELSLSTSLFCSKTHLKKS